MNFGWDCFTIINGLCNEDLNIVSIAWHMKFGFAFSVLFVSSKNCRFGFLFYSICVHSAQQKWKCKEKKTFMRRSFKQWGKTIDRTKNGFLLSYVTRCLAMGKRLIVLYGFRAQWRKECTILFALISKQMHFAVHCHIFCFYSVCFSLCFICSQIYCLLREIFYIHVLVPWNQLSDNIRPTLLRQSTYLNKIRKIQCYQRSTLQRFEIATIIKLLPTRFVWLK